MEDKTAIKKAKRISVLLMSNLICLLIMHMLAGCNKSAYIIENQWKSCPITFIEGFEFEQGYLFTLKVRIVHLANPPQDSYDVRYILVSLVSKTKVEE